MSLFHHQQVLSWKGHKDISTLYTKAVITVLLMPESPHKREEIISLKCQVGLRSFLSIFLMFPIGVGEN